MRVLAARDEHELTHWKSRGRERETRDEDSQTPTWSRAGEPVAEPHTEAEDLDQSLTASQTGNPTKVSLVSHSQASGDPWGVLEEGVDGYKLRDT